MDKLQLPLRTAPVMQWPASQLGFSLCQCRFIPRLQTIQRLLCLSDTHLFDDESYFADDHPALVFQLLVMHGEWTIAILGDFIEGLVLSSNRALHIHRSRRLRSILRLLQSTRNTWFVFGNHDCSARAFLRELFAGRASDTGYIINDCLILVHGHNTPGDLSLATNAFGHIIVPSGVTLNRLGVAFPFGLQTNRFIADRAGARVHFACFGHTHQPELTSDYANTGAILARGPQTLVYIDSGWVSLWQRHHVSNL